MFKRLYIVILFVTLTVFNLAYSQCAMCRAVLESEEGMKKAEAINDGIVYLMALPYIAVGIVFYMIYRMKFGKRSHKI
jgi:Na+/H+ antiporter NhaC